MKKAVYLTRAQVLDNEKRIVRATINTIDVDRLGTIIEPEGGHVDNFLRSSSILWNHEPDFPLGKPMEIEKTKRIMSATFEFANASTVPGPERGPMLSLSEDVWWLYSHGFVKGHSIGFDPYPGRSVQRADDVLVFQEWELVEFSLTSLPGNPNAYAEDKRAFQRFLRVTPHHEVRQYLMGLPKQTRRKLNCLIEEVVDESPGLEKVLKETSERKKYVERVTSDSLTEPVTGDGNIQRAAQESMDVQTLIFTKEKFARSEEAVAWAKAHDFRSDKVDETENTFRLRQFDPAECQVDSFKTFDLTDGVQAVGCRKEGREAADTAVHEPRQSVDGTPESPAIMNQQRDMHAEEDGADMKQMMSEMKAMLQEMLEMMKQKSGQAMSIKPVETAVTRNVPEAAATVVAPAIAPDNTAELAKLQDQIGTLQKQLQDKDTLIKEKDQQLVLHQQCEEEFNKLLGDLAG